MGVACATQYCPSLICAAYDRRDDSIGVHRAPPLSRQLGLGQCQMSDESFQGAFLRRCRGAVGFFTANFLRSSHYGAGSKVMRRGKPHLTGLTSQAKGDYQEGGGNSTCFVSASPRGAVADFVFRSQARALRPPVGTSKHTIIGYGPARIKDAERDCSGHQSIGRIPPFLPR